MGFRAVCSDFGADATVTEMLSARAMAHNPAKTQCMTLSTPSEKIKIAQIFGHEPEYMQNAVQNQLLQHFDAFDINMGCPAPKIVKNGEGAALMDNIPLAYKIISAVKNATEKPLSVKFRLGHKTQNYLEFARMCQDAGVSFITFHPRTVAQGYSGHSDYDALAQVVAKLSIPVVGSGDVVDKASLFEMQQTGVAGVMIGRGALGKPWLFKQLKTDAKASKQEMVDAIEKHICILREHFDEAWLKQYIRKHLLWYAGHLPNTAEVRTTLATCQDVDECIALLKAAIMA